jgi:hypothetical protein
MLAVESQRQAGAGDQFEAVGSRPDQGLAPDEPAARDAPGRLANTTSSVPASICAIRSALTPT